LAQVYGWHYGFGLAGVMMFVAAIVYFVGMRHLADVPPVEHGDGTDPITSSDWRRIRLIILVMIMTFGQFLAYDQIFNVGMIWVATAVDLSSPFGQVPVPWFASEDAIASVIAAPLLLALWAWQARRGKEPDDFGKMAIGAACMAISMLAMTAGAATSGSDGQASVLWPVIAFFFSGLAFMWTWPTMLALVSSHAPRQINAMMMAAVYLTAFVTSIGAGFVARWYESLGATQFFLLNASFAITGAILLWVLGPAIARRMGPAIPVEPAYA
jgi:POT family proton-dependent oligopeptide transporter